MLPICRICKGHVYLLELEGEGVWLHDGPERPVADHEAIPTPVVDVGPRERRSAVAAVLDLARTLIRRH